MRVQIAPETAHPHSYVSFADRPPARAYGTQAQAPFIIFLAIAGIAAALHWLAVRHHFRTCDFFRPLLLVAAGHSA